MYMKRQAIINNKACCLSLIYAAQLQSEYKKEISHYNYI